ncbi:MAG: hypothetical protein ACTHM2_18950 [Afipia sp.]
MARIPLIAILLTTFVATGFAQNSQRGGSGEQQQACAKDVSRYCRKVMDSDDQAIFACLKEHRARLSKACLKSLGGDRG